MTVKKVPSTKYNCQLFKVDKIIVHLNERITTFNEDMLNGNWSLIGEPHCLQQHVRLQRTILIT